MSDSVQIALMPLGKCLAVAPGTRLQDILHRYGVEFPCGGKGRCRGCRVKLLQGDLHLDPDERGILSEQEIAEGWRLACRSRAIVDATIEVAQWEAEILVEHGALSTSGRQGRGVAVDLGTTSMVAQLLDFSSGEVLGVRTARNPQSPYGADLITRLAFADTPEGRAKLVALLRDGVGEMIASLLASEEAAGSGIEAVAIAGNSVMHHFIGGLDTACLARAPFDPLDGRGRSFAAAELGWAIDGDPKVHVLPCLGGLVGGDILAGILATGMHESSELVGLIDLGTNGEIAFGNRDQILCASTAAGPAFEGGKIEMGMQAITGAICSVSAVEQGGENGGAEGQLHCHVLGGGEARGICGSGLVDAVAAALDVGWIASSGRILREERVIPLTSPVTLTQLDVRELQLAKAAIWAGAEVLLSELGAMRSDVRTLYLAGAFGNYVSTESARRIGLIRFSEEQVEAAGNTSLLGAKLALLGEELEGEAYASLIEQVRHVSLATDARFQKLFIDETSFAEAE